VALDTRLPASYVYVHLLLCNTVLITISYSLVLVPSPVLTDIFSNKGKTAYVYPAYELSLCLMALA